MEPYGREDIFYAPQLKTRVLYPLGTDNRGCMHIGDYFASGGDDEHILVWKTNMDSSASQVSKEKEKSSRTRSQGPAKYQLPAHSDKPQPPASAPLLNSKLYHQQEFQKQSLLGGRHPNPVPIRPDKHVSAGVPVRKLHDVADPVSTMLQHVVGQLDVVAATLALMENRLTVTEDRIRDIGAATG